MSTPEGEAAFEQVAPTNRFPFLDPVTRMIQEALGDALTPGVEGYLDLFHDDAVFEFPFSPGGAVRREGKSSMAAYLRAMEGGTVFERFFLEAAYPMDHGRTTVLEYRFEGPRRGLGVPIRPALRRRVPGRGRAADPNPRVPRPFDRPRRLGRIREVMIEPFVLDVP